MSDTKTRLKLTRCTISANGMRQVDSSKSFTVMINPPDFSQDSSIEYSKAKVLGQIGSEKKFAAMNPNGVSFTIVLEGTGTVRPATGQTQVPEVAEQIKALRAVVYDYVGDRHEPSHVQLLWGTFIFYGRLQSMSTKYILFRPSGAPLRANVSMRFAGAMTKGEEQLAANRSSPDLTHRVLVKAGDTLPLLCETIYGDPQYYPDVARVNGLSDFRNLIPGRELHFPPLE